MDFDGIFELYYTLYRLEAQIPVSTDDEYVIALPLANEAVKRWARYENTYWKELFTTLIESGEGTTIAADTTSYDTPEDFKEGGGRIRILDTNGNTVRQYRIIESQEAQFRTDNSQYAYFSGNPSDGYKLNLNPIPDSAIVGLRIDYDYYKLPTLFTTGTDITEVPEPDFIVHRMLGNRFRGSRNPYYSSALRDAEDILKTMQLKNNSGTWDNPWRVQDNSGSSWGL